MGTGEAGVIMREGGHSRPAITATRGARRANIAGGDVLTGDVTGSCSWVLSAKIEVLFTGINLPITLVFLYRRVFVE